MLLCPLSSSRDAVSERLPVKESAPSPVDCTLGLRSGPGAFFFDPRREMKLDKRLEEAEVSLRSSTESRRACPFTFSIVASIDDRRLPLLSALSPSAEAALRELLDVLVLVFPLFRNNFDRVPRGEGVSASVDGIVAGPYLPAEL